MEETRMDLTHCVYVLFSLADEELYVGYSCRLGERLNDHFAGRVQSTAHRRPLRLLHVEYYMKTASLIVGVMAAGLISCTSVNFNVPGHPPEYLTDAAGFIPYWIALESIPLSPAESENKALDVKYLDDEPDMRPVGGRKIKVRDETCAWRYITVPGGSPIFDCTDIEGNSYRDALTYLVAYVKLPADEAAASLYWGSDDDAALYVNGKEVDRYANGRICNPDSNCATNTRLHKGVNTIVVKLVNRSFSSYACVRLVDSNDRVMSGAPILPCAEEKGKPVYPWPRVDTGQEAIAGKFSEYLQSRKNVSK